MYKLFIVGIPLAAVVYTLLHFFKGKHKAIFVSFSLIPFCFILYRIINRGLNTNLAFTLQGLPFHICGISSILIIIAAITKNKLVFNVIYFVTMPATVFAMAIDNTSAQPWNMEFWCFVVPHLVYLILPLAMVLFRYLTPQLHMVKWVLPALICLIGFAHCVNLALNAIFPTANGFPTTNYIFTMYPGDCEGAPNYGYKKFMILEQLYDILPVPCLYLLLALPILAVVWLVLCLPLFLMRQKRRRAAR